MLFNKNKDSFTIKNSYLITSFQKLKKNKIIQASCSVRDDRKSNSNGYPTVSTRIDFTEPDILDFGFGLEFDFLIRKSLDFDLDISYFEPKPDPKFKSDRNPIRT